MVKDPRNILICSCDSSMLLDADLVKRACGGATVVSCEQACRRELEKVRTAVTTGTPLTIACTQEAPLFKELEREGDLLFVNIRETAGWSKDNQTAGQKMAALIAAAAEPAVDMSYVS